MNAAFSLSKIQQGNNFLVARLRLDFPRMVVAMDGMR
jgi:hypothetical protein